MRGVSRGSKRRGRVANLQIRTHLTNLEIMASLIAAVTHDLDHPGVNQPFLVATSNHLAALYQVSLDHFRKCPTKIRSPDVSLDAIFSIAEQVGSWESSLEVSDRVSVGERCLGSTVGQRETGTSKTHQLADSSDGHHAAAGVSRSIQGEPRREYEQQRLFEATTARTRD